MVYDVFLSYCREDSPIMARVRTDMQTAGLKVWTDEGIPPGSLSWKRSIQSAILDSVCLVAVLSPDAAESRWVMAEIDFAELHGKPIYLILARGDEREVVPFGYASSQWVDIRVDERYAAQVKQLIEAIQFRIENPAPQVPAFLPQPFEWCEVPAGEVQIDYGPDKGVRPFSVDRFYVSMYPITNAQYQLFLDVADGYADARWWDYSKHAATWRKKNSRPRSGAFQGDDLPRESVTWYEAVAFSRWLSARMGFPIVLPTEQQWQLAGQGRDQRVYPWEQHYASRDSFADVDTAGGVSALNGFDPEIIALIEMGPVALRAEMLTNADRRDTIHKALVELVEKADTSLCNTYESGLSKPVPVTEYKGGASPYGVMGLAGNVWEWCRTPWAMEEAPLTGNMLRVMRGGSWSEYQVVARLTSRRQQNPASRMNTLGFRVVCLV